MKKIIIITVCVIVFFVISLYIYTKITLEELTSSSVIPIPDDGIIPTGYYNIPGSTNMRPIPDGFKIINQDSSGNGTLRKMTQSEIYTISNNNYTGYSTDDLTFVATGEDDLNGSFQKLTPIFATSTKNTYVTTPDVEYHDSVEKIQEMDYANTGTWVKDSSGNQVFLPWTAVSKNFTYYTPGSLLYGPFSYVPDYKDSIYLSRSRPIGNK